MGQELAIPQAFQGKGMSQAFTQGGLNAQDDTLAEGIGQSYGVIGYKGKVWSGRYRGEKKSFIRPDDGTPASYLDVIVLGQAKSKSKSYYKAFDVNSSEGERPLCASIDGILPDADATVKQCDTCALCPRNAWKLQPNGRKGRECTDYKRLAVLVLPSQTKPVFGQPIMEPMFLRVPPDSLNSLAIMGETMSNQGFHYSSYITRITFDQQKAHPCMVFRPLQPLTDAEAPVILELTKDPLVGRITLGDSAGSIREAGTTAVAQALPPQQTPLPPKPTQAGAFGEALAPSAKSVPTSVARAVTPSAPAPGPEKSALSGLVFDTSGGVSTAAVTPEPSANLMDTGPAEASDDELDAKIAALIAPK